MRLLVTGDRNWKHGRAFVRLILAKVQQEWGSIDVVIEGECRGADICARNAAWEMGIPVIGRPAQWTEYGKAAGPIRNREMLELYQPSHVIAFHDDLSRSSGTADMLEQAKKAGVIVIGVYGSPSLEILPDNQTDNA